MADALDSGSSGSNPVRVQVPFSAFSNFYNPLKTQRFQGVFDSQITIWSKHGANCFFTKDGTIFQISPELLTAPGIVLFLFSTTVEAVFLSGNDQGLITSHLPIILQIIPLPILFMPVVHKD